MLKGLGCVVVQSGEEWDARWCDTREAEVLGIRGCAARGVVTYNTVCVMSAAGHGIIQSANM